MSNSLTPKQLLDVKQIIQFGSRKPEDYQILFYKEVYQTDKTVRIRGLSNYEYDEISIDMYNEIKDPKTIRYIFDPKNELKISEEEKEKDLLDKEIKDDIRVTDLIKAFTLRNVLIVFHAMKDFYKDLTIEDVKQLEGIDEIAKRINEKSGRTIEIMERIEFFRESYRKRKSPISNQEGTQPLPSHS